MSKKVTVAHATPGRLRVKIPDGKRNEELLRTAAENFGGLPGVERVDVNVVTGSIVLIYDPDRHDDFHGHFARSTAVEEKEPHAPKTEIDKLADSIENEAEFLAEHSASVRVVVDLCKNLDREIKKASGNNVDLRILLAGGVVAATVFEIGAAAATPVWVTLTLFAMNHFVELHQRPATTARAR
jgi:hypothetical protein